MNAKHVRTVELQLLRHGPPHNQLLSPLTDYLALCGDHPNTTLNFPLEHLSLVVRLRALRYQDSEETRKIQLHETAQLVANMLASVPGVISELGRRDSKSESLAHLSIATSASELSLVPFELATAPPGFPGSGASFCLQTEFPVCITRRSRQVRFKELKWDTDVRVLLVASDPMRMGLPLSEHIDVLKEIVRPWKHDASKDAWTEDGKILEIGIDDVLKTDRSPKRKLNRVIAQRPLTVLLSATANGISDAIQKAILEGKPFSHVHILAHGSELPNQRESSGVALHMQPEEGTDVVDGLRLGQALTASLIEREANYCDAPQEQEFHPLVVTITVCDSGKATGDMSKPGASVGFHVHEARIPFVVCSQFPLTKRGSVVFTKSLYSRLLNGTDPRISLWEARRELFSHQQERKTSVDTRDVPSNRGRGRHDWASIIAFASLPPSIERQTLRFERSQRTKRMESKLRLGDERWPPNVAPSADNDKVFVEDFVAPARKEVSMFDQFVDRRLFQSRDTRLLGISASANKRIAEFLYAYQTMGGIEEDEEWLRHIRQSYRRYLLISRRDANCRWAFVQRLFLKWFLKLYQSSESNRESTDLFTGNDSELRKEWMKSSFLCQESVDGLGTVEQIWNLTDQLELGLLCWLIYPSDDPPIDEKLWKSDVMLQSLHMIDQLALAGSGQARFAAYSGRRQLLRYRRFANMFYAETFPEKTSLEKTRSKSRSYRKWGRGYEKLKESFPLFANAYEEVEQVVLGQMEMGDL